MKVRQSNFELMRIVSMYMIVLYHLIYHGNLLNCCDGSVRVVILFIQSLLFVHVNSFILLTGYFQCEKSLRISKFLSLYFQVWFYQFIIPILLIIFISMSFSNVEFFQSISPIYYGGYWYITLYFILLLISPLLNIVIRNVTKSQHLKIIFLLFVIFSVLPTLTIQKFYNNSSGFSITFFILLYFIGSYFRLYPIEKNFIFSKLTLNARKLFFFSFYIVLAFVIWMNNLVSDVLIPLGGIVGYVGSMLKASVFAYDNPLVVIQAVCYFLFFYLLSIKSKFINKVSTLTLGVYLIHDNRYIRPLLQKIFGLDNVISYSSEIIILIFIYALIVIVLCFLLEMIRQFIFNFIYKRKISFKLRTNFKKYIESLGIVINW